MLTCIAEVCSCDRGVTVYCISGQTAMWLSPCSVWLAIRDVSGYMSTIWHEDAAFTRV
jgi:hypothetical protein